MNYKNTVSSCVLALATLASGCSGSSQSGFSGAAEVPSPSNDVAGAERAIQEADIIQMNEGKLYALSESGTVSIVDISQPGRLSLLGQTRLAGVPFEMYLRGNVLITMWNGAISPTGQPLSPPAPQNPSQYQTRTASDPNAGAAVVVLDITKPNAIVNQGGFPIPGELADSRLVGNVLYVATYENSRCYRCAAKPRTLVTSFDFQDPNVARQIHQAEFSSNAPESYNLAWGSNWKRSLFVNSQRLYIGGHADIDPNKLRTNTEPEGIIDVLDISDPTGRLVAGTRVQVAGAILSRWQMEERDGVLRVISQRGAGRTGNGIGNPEVNTFTIHNSQWIQPLGQTTIRLPRQEGLRSVRFDQDRAYAITYYQTDPLWIIDLRNSAKPTVRGELHMPGFMYYLQPHGDRLIGLGIDRSDPGGSLNVSLFNVEDMDHPTMIGRVPFATPRMGEDYLILNYELPEDQDRIQKAFRVFPDGVVAVPFTYGAKPYTSGDSCQSVMGGIKLVDWKNDTLKDKALLPMRGNPRRAFQNLGEIIGVSDSNVTSFSADSNNTTVIKSADVVIGDCVPNKMPNQTRLEDQVYNCSPFFGCNMSPTGSSSGGLGVLSTLGLIGFAWRRRNRKTA